MRGRRLVAAYAALLALYPPRFRREYGPALLAVVEQQVRDGDLPPSRLWMLIVSDVAGSLVPEHLANLTGGDMRSLLSAIDGPDVRRRARFGIVLGLVWTAFNVLNQGFALDARASAILSDAFLASLALVLVAAGLAGARDGAGAATGFAAAAVGSAIGIATMWLATWIFWQNRMQIAVDRFRVSVFPGLDPSFHRQASRAVLADEIDIRSQDGRTCSVIVSERERVLLATAFRYELAGGLGPAAALIPEPARLFLGAGIELLCYDLHRPRRLWRDQAECGIHGWDVIGDVVLMSAELELAAWDKAGHKLWTTFVEPPWSYSIDGDRIRLDVMGEISQLEIRSGHRSG